jgi:nucleoside-diphosphate-sugar epimerase
MAPNAVAVPEGSWVLLTGLTGYIASHVAVEFLNRGYKVRGSVRDLVKAKWLTEELFKSQAAKGQVELVEVPDMSAEGAFDAAVKGVSAVVHIAAVTTFSPDPDVVIPQTVAGALNAMNAAVKEPSVKQFVYTSTSVAAIMPTPGVAFHCDSSSWNDAAVAMARVPPPYEPSHGIITYMAGKVEAEKAVWKFAKDRKPHFAVNTVLPFMVLGTVLDKHQTGSTAGWVSNLYKGDTSGVGNIPASWFPFPLASSPAVLPLALYPQ